MDVARGLPRVGFVRLECTKALVDSEGILSPRFMPAQEEISAGRLSRRVGSEVEVLIDSVLASEVTGPSAGESPEIDGVVRLTDPGTLQIDDWARARITDSDSHNLTARVVLRA